MKDELIKKLQKCLKVKTFNFELFNTGSEKVFLTRDEIRYIISDLEKEKDINKRISENTSYMYDFMQDKW